MRWRGNILLAFGLNIGLLLSLSVSIQRSGRAVINAFEQYSLIRQRSIAIRDLTMLSQSVEHAQTNYLLTGMPEFLAEYERVSTHFPEITRQLRDTSAYDPELLAESNVFIALVDRAWSDMRRTLEFAKVGQVDQAVALLRSAEHRSMHDELSQRISGLVGTVRATSETQRKNAENALQQAVWWTVFLTIASVGSLFISFALVMQDRVRREKLNAELQVAVDEAKRSAQAKTDFLARMSHEIRTPLNGVLGMTQLLRDTSMSENQQEMTRVITGSGEALVHVIDDILDFSKIEAGRLELESISFLLNDSVQQWASIVRQQCNTKKQTLRVEIDPAMPQVLRGDQRRIGQVMLNLLSNATKFTPEGGAVSLLARCESLSVSASKPIARVRFEVHDTGIGIDNDTQKRLFEPFMQADSTTSRRYGGTGLGLVIARRIVEVMQGEMGLESEAGGGSTFWFTVPLVVAPAASVSQAQAIAEMSLNENSCQRVLVAEDDAVSRMVVAKHLETMGFACDVVCNGREAVEALAQRHYGLVLMDCQMPEMDGYAATRAIRISESEQHVGRIPIIALTANAIVGEQQRCADAGMDGYLTKPLDRRNLADALRRFHPSREP